MPSKFKQVLMEMPWASGVICPFCSFKFGFDAKIELWTKNKEKNSKFLKDFLKVKQLPLECPNCNNSIIHDFSNKKTYKYDLNTIDPTADTSIRQFFKKALKNIKPVLEIVGAVIPEKLSFQRFVDGQND